MRAIGELFLEHYSGDIDKRKKEQSSMRKVVLYAEENSKIQEYVTKKLEKGLDKVIGFTKKQG